MQKSSNNSYTKDPMGRRKCNKPRFPRSPRGYLMSLLSLLVTAMTLSGCGGSSSSSSQQNATLSGNWQFAMTNPDTSGNYAGAYGLQGGFLLANGNNVTGQVVYSVSGVSQSNGAWAICDSGTASVTGTISGQTVNLTVGAPSQTFALQGTLGANGVINGSFTTAGGTAPGFTSCGTATPQAGLSFTLTSVPPLTGSISGDFHSQNSTLLQGENFLVTGTLTQGQNIGASNASVTGTLSFIDPVTGKSDYPCVPNGILNVNGQISGNSVILQLIGVDGSTDGQIGTAPSQVNQQGNGTSTVTLNSTTNGYALQSNGLGYYVNTNSCFNGSVNNSDSGYVCLGLNNTSTCQQPITLSPAFLTFPAQALGSTTPSTQTFTLTNSQPGNAAISGLALSFSSPYGPNSDTGNTDFTELPNFGASDNCAPGGETLPPNAQPGASFTLAVGQSCTVTVSFAPQEECTWLPNSGGTPPAQCPRHLTATVAVDNIPSVDPSKTFVVPVTGSGLSFLQPSTPLLAFGSEGAGETSLPQAVSFTNTATTPVQILPAASCPVPYLSPAIALTHPLIYPPAPPTPQFPVIAAGLQVVSSILQDTNASTVAYACDLDLNTQLPNFQISSDTCSGVLLPPQGTCGFEITFVPQLKTGLIGALDYFLELNTVQCTDPVNDPPSVSNPCELDGGRFPIEIISNLPSPLRITPGASINFETVSVGTSSAAQTVTLIDDVSANETVPFSGRIQVSGNYSETDDCPFSLSPGASCVLTVVFKPSASGYNPGTLTINYTLNGTLQSQIVYLVGRGQ